MALDVTVKISLKAAGGVVGFGVPLILVSKADKAIAYGEYTDSDEVVAAGFPATTLAYKAFAIMKAQDDAPARIAIAAVTDKADIAIPDFKGKVRQVMVLAGAEDSTVAEIATAVEATDSMLYFPVVKDGTELAKLTGFDRTYAGVHSDVDGQSLAAATIGATAGREAGSFTYKNLKIKGVTPDDLTDGQIEAIDAANGYTIAVKAGDIVTTEGKAVSGEYLDITDAFDWIIQNIEYNAQKLLNSSPKLPYDNRGIAALEGATTDVLKEADNMGIIAHDEKDIPQYETNFGTRDEATAAQRAARDYALGRFSFQLAGAIHTAEINGTVTV